ncbi:MAG TPA: hypothetical protein VFL70_04495 [Bacteroidia bacterium]|nr:hypothetical protein [Bacteroidia bacterium]
MDGNVIELLKAFEVALISSIKFLFAPFEAERQGFSYRESLIITTGGGFIGILVFTFIGEGIAYSWRKFKSIFLKNRNKEKPIKKFSWATRLIIRIKNKFGLFGISMITPSIISIPLGTIVINRLYRRKFTNLLAITVSLIIWSLALNSIAYYLKLSQYLHIPK